ncbi:hypothetical protein [Mangrovibacterium marinum]|uniref:Uncharacterized protein n=1 Tax=Mangrovibacterium marinum TaxID=1639118 RepID=A0A2T5C4E2_9BACT|nr:hypothetical protein [Mangrovibacterium marinum]PTN09732.1 hypothetical protein C8N47_10316 [Mangrovibacterium marinum]
MKKLSLLFAAIFVATASFAQTETETSTFYSAEFNWHIDLPPGFEQIEAAVWDLQKGVPDSLLTDSLDHGYPKTILAFKSADYNYFESNWQHYDKLERGDYQDHCQSVANQLYQTFADQFPEAQIDTASSNQLVGTLDFEKFVLKMTLPNGVTLNSYMYSRLFGDKEFSANVFYVNNELGTMLLQSWLYSRFE